MRAGDLLGRPVLDVDGQIAGVILDIRITRRQDTPDPGTWEVDGVVIGHRWSLARAGYAYGGVSRPWPLAAVGRALGRHLRYVAWSEFDDSAAVLQRTGSSPLRHPSEV